MPARQWAVRQWTVLISVLSLCIFALATVADSGHAEQFLWGTEGQGLLVTDHREIPVEKQNIIHQINDVMGVKLVKVRLRLPMNLQWRPDMCSLKGAHYPSDRFECSDPESIAYNLDETVALFKANGWSMLPMFSHAGAPRQDIPIDQKHIDRYVDFIDWFLDRYREDADIRFIELVNAPYHTWKGTPQQLFELSNKTYERIKEKYPEVQVGTPGFEYYRDTIAPIRGGEDQFRFRTYFLEHDAKFDFWAFHGYPTLGNEGRFDYYPPTYTARQDKFAGIQGIAELRERLNENGWQQRDIIDTEHTGLLIRGKMFDENEDRVNAAFMAQQLVLKRALALDGKPVLAGIVTMKMLPRCQPSRTERTGDRKTSSRTRMQHIGPQGQRPPRPGQVRGPGQRPPRPPRQGVASRQSFHETDSQPLFDGECAWGSLYPDGSTSLSVKAVSILIEKLGPMNHAGHISGAFDQDNTVWIEKFNNGNQDVYVCFRPFSYTPGVPLALGVEKSSCQIDLPKKPLEIKITDISGNVSVIDPADTIQLSVDNVTHFVEVTY